MVRLLSLNDIIVFVSKNSIHIMNLWLELVLIKLFILDPIEKFQGWYFDDMLKNANNTLTLLNINLTNNNNISSSSSNHNSSSLFFSNNNEETTTNIDQQNEQQPNVKIEVPSTGTIITSSNTQAGGAAAENNNNRNNNNYNNNETLLSDDEFIQILQQEFISTLLFSFGEIIYFFIELFLRSIVLIAFLIKINNEATKYSHVYRLVSKRILLFIRIRFGQFISTVCFFWYYGISNIINWWLADVISIVEYDTLSVSIVSRRNDNDNTNNDNNTDYLLNDNNVVLNERKEEEEDDDNDENNDNDENHQRQENEEEEERRRKVVLTATNKELREASFVRSKELVTSSSGMVIYTKIITYILIFVGTIIVEYVFDIQLSAKFFDIQVINVTDDATADDTTTTSSAAIGELTNELKEIHDNNRIPEAIYYSINSSISIIMYYLLYQKLSKSA